MHIESYSEHVALLRSLGTLKQKGLSPRGVLFLALSSQGRIYLALPSHPEQLTSESLRVGEKMALRWPDSGGDGVPERLYHFDSIHALRDDFYIFNGDRRLKDPGNAMDVGTVMARFIRSCGSSSVFFGCTPHQPGSWLIGGPQTVALHDFGIVEVVPVPGGLIARKMHDDRLYLLTFSDISRTGHLEGWLPVFQSQLGNILLVERRVVDSRLMLSCERGLIEVDLSNLPRVTERSRLPFVLPAYDEDSIESLDDDLAEQLVQCPAVLGRLGSEAFVLTRGVPQPWGLRDLAPAELWTSPTGELREIESWLTQIGVAAQAL